MEERVDSSQTADDTQPLSPVHTLSQNDSFEADRPRLARANARVYPAYGLGERDRTNSTVSREESGARSSLVKSR